MQNSRTRLHIKFYITPEPNMSIIVFIIPFSIDNYLSSTFQQLSPTLFFGNAVNFSTVFKPPLLGGTRKCDTKTIVLCTINDAFIVPFIIFSVRHFNGHFLKSIITCFIFIYNETTLNDTSMYRIVFIPLKFLLCIHFKMYM